MKSTQKVHLHERLFKAYQSFGTYESDHYVDVGQIDQPFICGKDDCEVIATALDACLSSYVAEYMDEVVVKQPKQNETQRAVWMLFCGTP